MTESEHEEREADGGPEAASAGDPASVPPASVAPAAVTPGPNGRRRWETEDVDQPWTIGEAIGFAMRAITGHGGSVLGPILVITLVASLVAFAPLVLVVLNFGLDTFLRPPTQAPLGGFGASPFPPGFVGAVAGAGGFAVLTVLLSSVLSIALLAEAGVCAVRDVPVPPGRFGRALRRMPAIAAWIIGPVLVPVLLAGVVSLPGAVTMLRGEPVGSAGAGFIVVGVILGLACLLSFALTFCFTPFFLVDDGTSLVSAMKKSWRATKPYRGNLFLYGAALLPVALLTVIPILGIIPLALIWLGIAYAYVRSTGRNDLAWVSPDFASKSIRTFLLVTFGAILLVFGGLVLWVKSLPTLRGTAWSMKDTAIRASAILTGVAVIIVLLALLLPYALDRLEGRKFMFFVAARHVRSQKSGFLTVISILSICGVAISSCALSSVVSVMEGFSQDLKRKILGNNAHIVVDTTSAVPWADYGATVDAIRKTPGVVGATPVVHGEVMASSSSNLAGVIVTGIDPESINNVVDLEHNIEYGKFDYLLHPEKLTKLPANEVIGIGPGGEQYYKGAELPAIADGIDDAVKAVLITKPDRPAIVIGRELAKTLHVYVGDEVTLVSPLGDLGPMGIMPRTKRFRVAAVFYSGMYEYDATYVYTMLGDAQDYFGTGDKINAVDIKVDDAERAEALVPTITTTIARPELRVRGWPEINKNLFSALKLERFATFIILSVAIGVASFCIICTLLLMVTEKGKEIAILKATGASDRMILGTFMLEGVIIGAIGTFFGVATGIAICAGISWFGLRLDPEVYYIDRLPISVSGWNFLRVALAALGICTLSTVYPAYAASRLRPVDGLRHE